MLAGLLSPTDGEILIGGEPLGEFSEALRTRFRGAIGFSFQSNNLVPYLTALENVELMLRLNGELDRAGRVRNRELLERLGLAERMRLPWTAIRRPAATSPFAPSSTSPASSSPTSRPPASTQSAPTRWSRRSPTSSMSRSAPGSW